MVGGGGKGSGYDARLVDEVLRLRVAHGGYRAWNIGWGIGRNKEEGGGEGGQVQMLQC